MSVVALNARRWLRSSSLLVFPQIAAALIVAGMRGAKSDLESPPGVSSRLLVLELWEADLDPKLKLSSSSELMLSSSSWYLRKTPPLIGGV